MSDIFDLQKRQEVVQHVLEKRQVTKTPVMRVGVTLDVSGSAQPLYKSGTIQKTLDRLLPVALRFDDNGEMDVWSFDNSPFQLATVTKHDLSGYVQREILNRKEVPKWHGTEYAGVFDAVKDFYFGEPVSAAAKPSFLGGLFGGKKPQKAARSTGSVVHPAMALHITDGANSDAARAAEVLRAAQGTPIYWQMVGVGNPREFGFISKMAKELPNVGYVQLDSLDLTDEELYEKLLAPELCQWIQAR